MSKLEDRFRPWPILVVAAMALFRPCLASAQTITVSGKVHRYADVPGQAAVTVAGRTVTLTVKGPDAGDLAYCAYDDFILTTQTTTTTVDGSYNFTFSNPHYACCGGNPSISLCEYNHTDNHNTARPRAIVTVDGDETNRVSVAFASGTSGTYATQDVYRAPHEVSPNGKLWARRFGTGAYPVFYVEGLDPGNAIKSACEACPDPAACANAGNDTQYATASQCDGMLEIWRNSLAGGNDAADNETQGSTMQGPTFIDYLMGNGYSVWFIANGNTANYTDVITGQSNSIKGPAGDETQGLAYQAAHLMKSIRDTYHPGRRMAVIGYGEGGITVRAALAKWCSGAWSSASGGLLDADCPAVSLWVSGDAPHQGATIPQSFQGFLQEFLPEQRYKFKSAMLREVLNSWVADGCDPGCNDNDGCRSNDAGQWGYCPVDNSVRSDFETWLDAAGWPQRTTGDNVPAVAFSVGTSPSNPSNEYCASGESPLYLHRDVSTCTALFNPDSYLYLNYNGNPISSNVPSECAAGSLYNGLLVAEGLPARGNTSALGYGTLMAGQIFKYATGYPMFPSLFSALSTIMDYIASGQSFGDWLVSKYQYYSCPADMFSAATFGTDITALSTYVASSSALMGTDDAAIRTYFRDYWYHPYKSRYHFAPLPQGATRTLLAWISAYLKGPESIPLTATTAPVCSPSAGSSLYDAQTHPYKTTTTATNPISNLSCRPFSLEVGGNGVDDDGDEQIDESNPPVAGAVESALDDANGNNAWTSGVADGGTLRLTGWAGDIDVNSAVTAIKVYIKVRGTASIGSYYPTTNTLNTARPDIASQYARTDWANSGWQARFNTTPLNVNTAYTATVKAVEVTGIVSTLGTIDFKVVPCGGTYPSGQGCSSGCCSAGVCVAGNEPTSYAACGNTGWACLTCPANQACQANGVCSTNCGDDRQCNGGCCSATGMCVTGGSSSACGKSGFECANCTGPDMIDGKLCHVYSSSYAACECKFNSNCPYALTCSARGSWGVCE